jgi:hypothetical protein
MALRSKLKIPKGCCILKNSENRNALSGCVFPKTQKMVVGKARQRKDIIEFIAYNYHII